MTLRKRKTDTRILAFALALLLLLALCPRAFAEDLDAENSAGDAELPVTEENPDEAQDQDWETRLLLMLQEKNANPETIGAGYYNFVTGEEHYYNGDQYRVSGSMYKVPLNMLFLDWIAEGKLEPDGPVYGYRYSELLNGTIIDSNNDYARIMWDYAGSTIETNPASTAYHRYRILIAPIMGEDPDNVDDKYYENNFFTPRQVITCLKQLYNGGEKYDRLIETMQRAEPEKYFKLRERRFNIAHKYGWYAEDPILYLNDCALCFTDDPIAIVLFTTGTENAYGVLADYCTLMCDYAQEKHAERVAREEEEAAAAAAERDRLAAEALQAELQTQRQATDTTPTIEIKPTAVIASPTVENRQVSYHLEAGPIVALAAIVVMVLAAIVWFAIRHREGGLNLPYGLLAILLAASAMILCFPGLDGRSYISVPDENAQNTVVQFFDALKAGDYEIAESFLSSGLQLGLPGPESAGMHSEALRALEESWDYRMLGDCREDKARAWQELQLQVLNFSRMETDLQRETRSQLLSLARDQSREAVYDESGNYRPEVAAEAYDRAMMSLLGQPQGYYSSVGLRVELMLTKDGWKIVPTKELFSALCGMPG